MTSSIEVLRAVEGLDPAIVTVICGTIASAFTSIATDMKWSSSTKRNVALAFVTIMTIAGVAITKIEFDLEAVVMMLTATAGSAQIAFMIAKKIGIADWLQETSSNSPSE